MTDEDRRVTCLTCRHYKPHQCGNHKAAGLYRGDVAPAFAALRQWCGGYHSKTLNDQRPIVQKH